jgi:hypothetical protein
MHCGSLSGDCAAVRVYAHLLAREGVWVSAWDLTIACKTTAVSTRISEVRHRLEFDERWDVESHHEDGHWYYRVVRLGVMEPLLC